MKISFVATVLNEEKTIEKFLQSVFSQSRLPDEIVIVDGGSLDSTLSRIFNFQFSRFAARRARFDSSSARRAIFNKNPKSKKIKFRPLTKTGLTIAQGRNYGIRKATFDIIAMSDAGCVLHKDWLQKITEPFFKENVDIVAGFYQMRGSQPFQKALAVYLGIPPQRFDSKLFLPSARSIAFKKSLWEKIGGFDEALDRAGEDTLFNYRAIKLNARFERVKDALVDWEVPKNLWGAALKFYYYAKGDVQAGIWWHPLQKTSTHNLKIIGVFIRYTVGLVLFFFSFQNEVIRNFLPGIVLIYLIWPIWKMRDLVTDFKARLLLPIVQIVSDIAVLFGTGLGILRKL